jgi:pimeloyl-ACP methyl ester carboxylesterase
MRLILCGMILAASAARAADPAGFDAAAAFGAIPSISHAHLSPDGKSISYLGPKGLGNIAYVYDLAVDKPPIAAVIATGSPDRLDYCSWVSNSRLACQVSGSVKSASYGVMHFTRLVAADRTGGNLKLLSKEMNEYSRGYELSGGDIIDLLPDEDGAVLMERDYVPDDHLGSHVGSAREGLGVDRIDTRDGKATPIEIPGPSTSFYLSDGRGSVRVMAKRVTTEGHQNSGVHRFYYRKQNSKDWLPLSTYDGNTGSGFYPLAINYDQNLVYGKQNKDGRDELDSISLDGSLQEAQVFAHPSVDVSDLVTIGRRNRVVGVQYVTDVRNTHYFDPSVQRMMQSLAKALPANSRIEVADSSVDEQVMLVIADRDDDPGVCYVFDRQKKELKIFSSLRPQLEGVKLAKVQAVQYPAADGTLVPGYLTLPPNVESAKGLPAIVLPHGGPSARDEWGFNWMAQFYANRGYAVLQPNFRGSAGYGDAWLQQNGFKSWRTAIGDVLDAGRWMIKEGIADPAKLSVVGWSYGGYAALQSAVVQPGFFKAVVAIAPVTDLQQAVEEWRHWTNFREVQKEIGEGPHVKEGSPARNAEAIKVPVLLFHGTLDRNVSVAQSRTMDGRLQKTSVKHQLVVFEGLDHYLQSSDARTEMLRKSDEFMRAAWAQ